MVARLQSILGSPAAESSLSSASRTILGSPAAESSLSSVSRTFLRSPAAESSLSSVSRPRDQYPRSHPSKTGDPGAHVRQGKSTADRPKPGTLAVRVGTYRRLGPQSRSRCGSARRGWVPKPGPGTCLVDAGVPWRARRPAAPRCIRVNPPAAARRATAPPDRTLRPQPAAPEHAQHPRPCCRRRTGGSDRAPRRDHGAWRRPNRTRTWGW